MTELSKRDVRRALVRYHFAESADVFSAVTKLKSVQFDPLAPVGCNHDLVLQSRVPHYKIGDWMKDAYQDRSIYDGWDKMACLLPMDSWPLHRYFHHLFQPRFEKKIFTDHADAVQAILSEIQNRGPLQPKDCRFQQRREDWKQSWFGPSVAKNTMRALWHTGQLMTAGRKGGQHLYDLTERIVPSKLRAIKELPLKDAQHQLFLDRHLALGLLRPSAAFEVWSGTALYYDRKEGIAKLLDENHIVPVEVEGAKANATHEFLKLLDLPSLHPQVRFIAPLDQFMWDRKLIRHLFDFDYCWEVYTPESKRKWGYYVLPVLYGDQLVARVEFWARKGELEVRQWYEESSDLPPHFWQELQLALRRFMHYSSTHRISVLDHIPPKAKAFFLAVSSHGSGTASKP